MTMQAVILNSMLTQQTPTCYGHRVAVGFQPARCTRRCATYTAWFMEGVLGSEELSCSASGRRIYENRSQPMESPLRYGTRGGAPTSAGEVPAICSFLQEWMELRRSVVERRDKPRRELHQNHPNQFVSLVPPRVVAAW